MTSNAPESLNSWILEARNLTITRMIDLIRMKLMAWVVDRREKSLKCEIIFCPKYDAKLRQHVLECKTWGLRRSSLTPFEIYSNPSVTVDLSSRTCSYRHWKLDWSHVHMLLLQLDVHI